MAALLVAKYERQRNVTDPHPRHDRFYWQHWQRSIDLLVKVGDLSLTDAAICHAVAGFSNASGKTVYPAQQTIGDVVGRPLGRKHRLRTAFGNRDPPGLDEQPRTPCLHPALEFHP